MCFSTKLKRLQLVSHQHLRLYLALRHRDYLLSRLGLLCTVRLVFYQFWVHTELLTKLPAIIEYVFNTPSHHRVHHASNIRYLDCNHGGVLILWDRWFGTFSEEKDIEKPVYGLTENLKSYHPINVATHEYQAIWRDVARARKWSDKLKYIFYAPGWSHDGADKRAKTLRRNLNN